MLLQKNLVFTLPGDEGMEQAEASDDEPATSTGIQPESPGHPARPKQPTPPSLHRSRGKSQSLKLFPSVWCAIGHHLFGSVFETPSLVEAGEAGMAGEPGRSTPIGMRPQSPIKSSSDFPHGVEDAPVEVLPTVSLPKAESAMAPGAHPSTELTKQAVQNSLHIATGHLTFFK
ncbi:hypothetical protein BV898_05191 [Hypsibius exemplaris]|uniref:Uncharacterized protein n=1 Tax=Hypsibius exemplaris TaxID=2072580 RepID=A0A1W0X062_HYPEX|nr:hypothetical protein BV898_05191 [Hypsibius exemplaris]